MAPRKKTSTSSKPRNKNRLQSSRRKTSKTASTSQSDADDDDTDTVGRSKSISKHKNFGKYRCLAESTSTADSGLDTEYEALDQQTIADGELYDSILISNDAEIIDNVATEYTDMEGESVEIIATEISQQLSDLHVFNETEYYIEQTVPAEEISCEQEVEIGNSSEHEDQVFTSSDENVILRNEPGVQKTPNQNLFKNVTQKAGNSTKATKRNQSVKKNKKGKKNEIDKKTLDSSDNSLAFENIRRSVRIKCKETSKTDIVTTTKPKKNVKGVSGDSDTSNFSNSSSADSEKVSDSLGSVAPISEYESDNKPVKVKSRWRRSSELEMENHLKNQSLGLSSESEKEDYEDPLKTFVPLRENVYLTPKFICKEAKKMACDCVLTVDEIARGDLGCSEDCLNRLLMIECGSVCPVNERCSNKKFQKCEFAPCEVFRTNKKGLGIRATADIPYGQFILEYVGEVIGPDEFEERATDYSKDKNPHHYFMALRTDAVIDATAKGNISRFINHSCDPNAETQKWTVNGELRIGFFSKRTILLGEEITFDYQFQRYGKEAQRCLCEASTCRGWLGAEPDEEVDEEEEEEEEVEEEVDEVPELVQPLVETTIVEDAPQVIENMIDEDPPVLEIEQVDQPPLTSSDNEDIPMPVITPIDQPAPVEVKKAIKKEKKKIIKRKVRKEILFENVDVDGEIEMLITSGLKNQAHTLKLSRLMVRATEVSQRSSLLRILRRGELPCRRLFLDYHGLRLIYGWMNDAQQLCKTDRKRESLRLELLQTLATLPIPNKTMLQDSKVLPTVDVWSKKLEDSSGVDSESNSPKVEMDTNTDVTDPPEEVTESKDRSISRLLVSAEFQIGIRETKDIRRSVGMDRDCRKIKNSVTRKRGKELIQDIIDMFDDDEDEEAKRQKDAKQDMDYEVEIIALALKLLEEWSVLKEVFRIPKKERIEQMKEHEREADRVYNKSGLDRDSDKRSGLYSRYRILKKSRNTKPDFPDRSRKHTKSEDNPLKHINKHERRKLFAMQVEQRDMWRQHELQCMSLGTDPRYTPTYDYTRNLQCVWNQQTGQWQPIGVNQSSIANSPSVTPSRYFNFNTPPTMTNMPPPPIPTLPTQTNIPPFSVSPTLNIAQLAMNNIPRPTQIPPLQPTPNLTTNLSNALANLITLSGIQQLSDISGLASTNTFPNITQPIAGLTPPVVHNTTRVPNIQAVISLPSIQTVTQDKVLEEDCSQVKFAGPIPPPVKLPPKWKCAKDKFGRPYYYHIKIRISQWEPPEFPPPTPIEYEDDTDSSSCSNTSSSSDVSSTDESDEEDDGLEDNKLLLQIRKKFEHVKSSPTLESRKTKSPVVKVSLDDEIASECLEMSKLTSLDERLQQEFNLSTKDDLEAKRRGLVTEVYMISPRTEEDKILAKSNLRKYKQNKQRLKRHKVSPVDQYKSQISITLKQHKSAVKAKVKDLMDLNTEEAKKIKEAFRTAVATSMVGILNPYRKRDCMQGQITNTEDFKHLARKLTLFVMLKQLKNCDDIEELICTENVKTKAKVFVSKYMSKFGEIYIRPKDDAEYY